MLAAAVASQGDKRLLSLDFMRGLIMVLLAMESTGLYEHLSKASGDNSLLHSFFQQFFHHPWNGLRFWDLIQPGFMFIAGTAMAFSLHKQASQGMTWNQSFRKILKRCFWLFFWGVLDYAIKPKGLSFELWDVLTQLSFTTLVAFLIFRLPATTQIMICVGLLLLTEMLYRFTNIPGFDQPFTDQHNFGNYTDLLLMNKINKDGWVAINCLIVGYGLDIAGITPIIKRIATSSFTLASLGWCLAGLAACYWWIDVLDHKKYLKFFIVISMNSIFIYLFFEILGGWFNRYVGIATNGLMDFINTPENLKLIITSLCIFTLEWLLCYFLYRKKIFFKL